EQHELHSFPTRRSSDLPYRLCAKVSEKSILQRKKKRSRKNPEDTLRMEEGENPRSRGMPRPCAYALGDPAQSKRIQFHGVSQRRSEEHTSELQSRFDLV